MTKTFMAATTTAVVLATALAGTTSAFTYLAGMSTEGPKCAGRASLEGYHIGTIDLWVPAVWSALIVFTLGFVAFGRSNMIRNFLRDHALPVFEFTSIRVTLGESMIYSMLFVALAMLGVTARFSIMRYNAIGIYCLT